jgi:CubicO group peptidase (beta-lactamase class C family)
MKIMNRNLTAFILGLIIIAASSSCKKESLPLNSNAKVFSVAKFKSNLQSVITNSAATQPRGYSFVINKDGVWVDTTSFGSASINASNASFNKMHVNQEINIASVTKTFTAIAVFQLIKTLGNGVTIKSKIGEWLPAYWNAKQAIKDITFEQLMTHSSGLTESNTGYDSLKATVARGLDDPTKPFDVYANINFALFRAMIPYMRDKAGAVAKENAMLPGNAAGFENWLSLEYIDYMQNKVFTPIGLNNATCNPAMNTAQAFSETNGVGMASTTPGDWTNVCGGGGYYMSVMEMARVMAYLAHSYDLLDKDQRKLMDDNFMGWDNEDSPMTTAGQAYGKDGALWWDSNNNNVQDNGDCGLQTFVIKFPNGVELSLIINSIPGNYRSFGTLVTNAYNNAWVEQ